LDTKFNVGKVHKLFHYGKFTISVDGHSLKVVREFRYLGALITELAKCDRDMKQRQAQRKMLVYDGFEFMMFLTDDRISTD